MNVYTSNIATSQTDLTGKSNFERDLNVKLGFDPNWKTYVYVMVSYDLFLSKTMVKHRFWRKQLFVFYYSEIIMLCTKIIVPSFKLSLQTQLNSLYVYQPRLNFSGKRNIFRCNLLGKSILISVRLSKYDRTMSI